MKRRNEFLTFICACIPGVGYMYNGLIKRGVQVLGLYILIGIVLDIIGLDFLSPVIRIPFWLYTFFDTYNVARRMDNGEVIMDSDFVLKRYIDYGSYSENDGNKSIFNARINKKGWLILGWSLVILGLLSVVNRLYLNSDIYRIFRSNISQYFFPAVFIFVGCFLLFKRR